MSKIYAFVFLLGCWLLYQTGYADVPVPESATAFNFKNEYSKPISKIIIEAPCSNPVVDTENNTLTTASGSNTSISVDATGTSLSYQWQVSTDNGSTFTNLSNGTNYEDVKTATLTIRYIPDGFADYQYRCIVSEESCSSISGVTTLNLSSSPLCDSSPNSFGYEYVSSVSINGVTFDGNTDFSGPGYYDYTAETIPTVAAGTTVPVSVTVETSSSYQEYVKIWIDFNRNGTPGDVANELVFDQNHSFSGSHTFNGNIAIPADAYNGNLYARLIMQYSGSPNVCGSYGYGNTFDFKIPVTSGVEPISLNLSLNKSDGSDGAVISSPAGIDSENSIYENIFEEDEEVTLTATPASGSRFEKWSGAVESTDNPLLITMEQSKALVAIFSPILPPSVISVSASNTTTNSAEIGGNVIDDGGATVNEKGVVYNNSGNPTSTDIKVQIGSGLGAFSKIISGLSPSTTYYVKAYAINSEGISYGEEKSFTTASPNTAPVASNVEFTGTLEVEHVLTASYDYSDDDNDAENGTHMQWYRSDDDSGSGKIAIPDADEISYTLTNDDIGKYISFAVTPHDGNSEGTKVESSLQGAITYPDIVVKGKDINISNGDNSPESTDATDFGLVVAANGEVTQTFSIVNPGTADLQLSKNADLQLVSIEGTDAADFSLSSAPVETISAGNSSSFSITFDPASVGEKSAVVKVLSNVSGKSTYTFTVKGTGTNTAPVASDVTISGIFAIGELLNGEYQFSDADNDTESNSVYQWYRSDDETGTNKAVISEADAKTYTLQSEDKDKYISFSVLPDDGTDAGLIVESDLQWVWINDAPAFTKGADQSVLEDAGAQSVANWATDISAGSADEADQTLTFQLSNDNEVLFDVQPAIDTEGTLTYTPAEDANGTATVSVTLSDDGGTANGGEDTSDEVTFTITINPVNDAPAFTKGADQSVLEDSGEQSVTAWATDISAGSADEADQTLTFQLSNDNEALFDVEPAIDAEGTLTYTPAEDANGTATVSVTLSDDGGTANGREDTSEKVTFTITISPVNDAPAITKGTDQSVLEDSGEQSVTAWATDISVGSADEADQTLTFQLSNDNEALFGVQPAIDTEGTLTYTPAEDANGTATVTVTLSDDGGTENGGVDTSEEVTFTITISPVNDAPAFTKGAGQSVLEDAGAQSVANWATDISVGSADEADQTLTFQLSNDNEALFDVEPAIDAEGTLTYTPAEDANGTATVTVTLSDDGGTANGGEDTSDEVTFTITINPVNDAPFFTAGSDQTVSAGAESYTISGWARGIAAGPANESSQELTFQVSNDHHEFFTSQPAVNSQGDLSFAIAADVSGDVTVRVSLSDDGGTANGGADSSEEASFTISIGKLAQQISFAGIDDKKIGQDPITLNASGGDSGNPVTYSLITAPASGVASLEGNLLVMEGIGTVTVIASQAGSDTYEAAEDVSVSFAINQNELFLPTLFSPNGDQNNDFFILRGAGGVASIEMTIYNREGELVYRSTDFESITQKGWDGTYQRQALIPGNYVWVLKGSYTNGEPLTVNGKNTGTIRLIR
ncbi:choice-of-anchor D domain-containing protein [Catalinimonas alkaloidigena]|uniref:choice-of-anchor D domain-containing protein n=1 Tax=Catalinimonas alkaloidigena TaxID=1075417 RepID=UPI002406784A|nr:Ig-like domain-containing protein [Catalinimonas alkaloidigena]